MPKKKADTTKPEVWVCFDADGIPIWTADNAIDPTTNALSRDSATTWRDLLNEGWRCVRMVEAEDAART